MHLRQHITKILKEYSSLQSELLSLQPGSKKYIAVSRAISNLMPAISISTLLEKKYDLLQEFQDLSEQGLLDINYKKEWDSLQEEITELEDQLKRLSSETDEEVNSIFLEIRAGSGGQEAGIFCADLGQMYLNYCVKKGLVHEILNISPNENQGYREITIKIEGRGIYRKLQHEGGVHRVQRVPDTESQGRIHTSTVTVSVLPSQDTLEDVHLEEKSLRIDTMKASGAGGQHVNKTDSAVRIIHLPTGLKVECQSDRSQHRNKEQGLKILKARLLDFMREKQQKQISQDRLKQVGTGSRSERIRTYNYPQKRISDHRLNKSYFKFDNILSGDLDPMLDDLALHFYKNVS